MRIAPNYSRLRATAITCWALGGWWIVAIGLIAPDVRSLALIICMVLLGAVLLALGIAFWSLGSDRRAGIMFDSKGLLLNLGHSASFVSWDNIERVGVSARRSNLLALGSAQQLGVRLRNPQPYLQSYEVRLPAARGPLARALQFETALLGHTRGLADAPDASALARTRAHSGYDILVPESMLGGSAREFVRLMDSYREQRSWRTIAG